METPEALGNWHNKGYGAILDHFRSLSWGKFSLGLIEDDRERTITLLSISLVRWERNRFVKTIFNRLSSLGRL